MVPAAASGFGAGIGRAGLVCGAVSGAAIVAGLSFGNDLSQEERGRLYGILRDLVRSFEERFGSATCRELIGYDLSDPSALREARDSGIFVSKCAGFVEFCASEICRALE